MSDTIIKVPRIGVNDDFVTIGDWFISSGSEIKSGQQFVSLETTKETVELEAEIDGYIYYRAKVGDELPVDSELAIISTDIDFKFDDDAGNNTEYIATKKAERLIKKYNVQLSKIDTSQIVVESDILHILGKAKIDTNRSKTNDVIILGGGGMAKMCIDLIKKNKAYNIHGILDPDIKKGTYILDVPVIGSDDDLASLRTEGYMCAVNAIGSISAEQDTAAFNLRRKIFKRIKENDFFAPTLIHPSAQIAESAQIGEGCIIMENAVIGPDAIIGDDTIINTGAIVSHDCEIGKHVRISPGSILAGNVQVGNNSLIGMGVTVYIGVKIGGDTIISNGNNIFSDIDSGKSII